MAITLEISDTLTKLWNVWALARLALAEGQPQRAARLFGAWEVQQEIYKDPLDLADQEDTDREQAQVRAALGETAFAVAWAEGRAMSLEEAVAYALEE